MNNKQILSIDIDVFRGSHKILESVCVEAKCPSALFLIGPVKVGKTTLLKSLIGHCDDGAPARLEGTALLGDAPVESIREHIVFVPQKAQFDANGSVAEQIEATLDTPLDTEAVETWLEDHGFGDASQLARASAADVRPSTLRALSVLTHLEAAAEIYLVDEPTFGMNDEDAALVRERLRTLAAERLVLIATHNRKDCIEIGGDLVLLSGGRQQETAPVKEFFENPSSEAGRSYVGTGSCNEPDPSPFIEDECEGCWWAVKGLLCGMSRPGLVSDLDVQLDWLARNDIAMLVCLEERPARLVEPLRQRSISYHHFSIRDMEPPSFSQAVDFCRLAEPYLSANRGVALHCRGGLGRTGTMIACMLVWYGDGADEAISRVRRARPGAVQSDSQSLFVRNFAERIQGWHSLDPIQSTQTGEN